MTGGPKEVIYFAVGIAILFIAPLCSQAAVFIIPDGDVAALISAINVANTNGADDTIELAADGSYTFLEPTDSCFRTALPPILNDGGRTLTIQGNGARILRDDGNPNHFPIFLAGVDACVGFFNVTISHGLRSTRRHVMIETAAQ